MMQMDAPPPLGATCTVFASEHVAAFEHTSAQSQIYNVILNFCLILRLMLEEWGMRTASILASRLSDRTPAVPTRDRFVGIPDILRSRVCRRHAQTEKGEKNSDQS